MNTWIKVGRYHLVDRTNFLILPWTVLTFAFVADIVVLKLTPAGHASHRYVGGLASIAVMMFVCGVISVARSLPFGLALGVSRRTYFAGTAMLALALAVAYGLVIAVLQVIEGSSGGWGMDMAFFRVPYLLDGPWYQTWLTATAGLAMLFVYGSWWGLVYRRWAIPGIVAFAAGQAGVLLLGAVLTTWTHAWHDIGHFFTTLSATGLTGVWAALVVALGAGGFVTIRRVTI